MMMLEARPVTKVLSPDLIIFLFPIFSILAE
jgi:hypothetical protein